MGGKRRQEEKMNPAGQTRMYRKKRSGFLKHGEGGLEFAQDKGKREKGLFPFALRGMSLGRKKKRVKINQGGGGIGRESLSERREGGK